MTDKPAKRGPKSRYDPDLHPRLAKAIAKLGGIDRDIALELDVSVDTVMAWRRKFPAFKAACAQGKAVADRVVEESLYKLATGFHHDAEQITVTPSGQVVRVPVVEYVKPDAKSAIHWLACRKPHEWPRDPKGAHVTIDLTGALDGPEGLAKAMAALLAAMGRGEITVSQAQEMAKVIEFAGASIERNQIAERVKVLEIEGPK